MSSITRLPLSSAQQKLQDAADQKRKNNNSSSLNRRSRDLLNLKINCVVRNREEESPFNPNRARDNSNELKKYTANTSGDYVVIEGSRDGKHKEPKESSI